MIEIRGNNKKEKGRNSDGLVDTSHLPFCAAYSTTRIQQKKKEKKTTLRFIDSRISSFCVCLPPSPS
ncbi:Uncharacterized protein APZ42_005889 [Daphnia magna]|uniref:Uncharacterized protein n=1 Tax=Daphnia magna TaxID=35525 RepID=A0A162BXB7_9CRUS|nr:Uncharacterized protein APZ42_005889 [Daphnia magna]